MQAPPPQQRLPLQQSAMSMQTGPVASATTTSNTTGTRPLTPGPIIHTGLGLPQTQQVKGGLVMSPGAGVGLDSSRRGHGVAAEPEGPSGIACMEPAPAWLNLLVSQLWPWLKRFIEDIVKVAIPVVLDASKPDWVGKIELAHINLGQGAPTVTGLQVIEQSPEEVAWGGILLHAEIAWHSDEMEAQMRVQPLPTPLSKLLPEKWRVKLEEFTEMQVGVKRLALKAKAQVRLAPLRAALPILRAVQVSLLEPPEELDLGITVTEGMYDWPTKLVRPWLASAVERGCQSLMLPEMATLVLDLTHQPFPPIGQTPQGLLLVRVLRAYNLPKPRNKKHEVYARVGVRQRSLRTTGRVSWEDGSATWQDAHGKPYVLLVQQPERQPLLVEYWEVDDDPLTSTHNVRAATRLNIADRGVFANPGRPQVINVQVEELAGDDEGALLENVGTELRDTALADGGTGGEKGGLVAAATHAAGWLFDRTRRVAKGVMHRRKARKQRRKHKHVHEIGSSSEEEGPDGTERYATASELPADSPTVQLEVTYIPRSMAESRGVQGSAVLYVSVTKILIPRYMAEQIPFRVQAALVRHHGQQQHQMQQPRITAGSPVTSMAAGRPAAGVAGVPGSPATGIRSPAAGMPAPSTGVAHAVNTSVAMPGSGPAGVPSHTMVTPGGHVATAVGPVVHVAAAGSGVNPVGGSVMPMAAGAPSVPHMGTTAGTAVPHATPTTATAVGGPMGTHTGGVVPGHMGGATGPVVHNINNTTTNRAVPASAMPHTAAAGVAGGIGSTPTTTAIGGSVPSGTGHGAVGAQMHAGAGHIGPATTATPHHGAATPSMRPVGAATIPAAAAPMGTAVISVPTGAGGATAPGGSPAGRPAGHLSAEYKDGDDVLPLNPPPVHTSATLDDSLAKVLSRTPKTDQDAGDTVELLSGWDCLWDLVGPPHHITDAALRVGLLPGDAKAKESTLPDQGPAATITDALAEVVLPLRQVAEQAFKHSPGVKGGLYNLEVPAPPPRLKTEEGEQQLPPGYQARIAAPAGRHTIMFELVASLHPLMPGVSVEEAVDASDVDGSVEHQTIRLLLDTLGGARRMAATV